MRCRVLVIWCQTQSEGGRGAGRRRVRPPRDSGQASGAASSPVLASGASSVASTSSSSSVIAPAEIVEEAAQELVEEHEPELGLSDDVFPARAMADDEAEVEATDEAPEAKTGDEAAPEA